MIHVDSDSFWQEGGWKRLKPPSETSYGIIPWLIKLDEWWGWHWRTVMGLLLHLLFVVCYPPLEKRDHHWSSILKRTLDSQEQRPGPSCSSTIVVLNCWVCKWNGLIWLDGFRNDEFRALFGDSVGRGERCPKISDAMMEGFQGKKSSERTNEKGWEAPGPESRRIYFDESFGLMVLSSNLLLNDLWKKHL